ncbi:serine hydrolase domain-containing protein [Olivibacter domesticus]|uniref:CubicO group peptidase, beta-lactamase class C family n=1 Tax=Olivibacter domesticus TaxID=407022 RepID=A0A1H7MGF5_OLID1|nr:serine hydrolase domain-containing protein [Olivibacter domesticus]SEL10252.1 CubicO group peptidase, beta-lactamase class C family [Olivibacter domesticus]
MNKRKTSFLTLFFMVLLCNMVNAQRQHESSPIAEIDQLLKKIDTVLQKEHIPGLMISIVKKDSILFSGGLGYADLEQKIKVDQTTQFHLASITKFFVAMGIQKLIAEGKLKLNDRLQSIAPEIPYTNKWESTHPVRLVHLLEHTAGFEDIQLNKMINTTGKPLTGINKVKAVESSLNSRWKPGERMSYSNPGYNVLGYIIEKVSGISWNAYIQQALFKPLAMNNTLFDLSGERQQTYAKGYDFSNGSYTLLPFYMPSSNGASSALVSNATDMAKFMHYLLNVNTNNHIDLLSGNDILEMEKVHSTLASQHGLQTGYALGNDLFPNNKKVTFRGHNGKGEGFSSWIFFNREAGMAYTISANCNTNLWPVSQLIEDFLTKDIAYPTMNSIMIDKSKIEPMLGYYQFMNPKNERWEFYRRIFGGIKLLSIDEDKLIVDRGRGQIDSLIHMGNGIFRLKGNIIPSCVIGHDHGGHPFFQGYGNSFYSKTIYLPILLQKIPVYLGSIAALLSIIYAIVGIPLALFKKLKIIDLCIVLLPALGIVCFLASYRLLGTTDAVNKELFTSANSTSIFIFAGMLFFGISVMIAAYLLYKRWHQIKKKWIKFPLVFNIIFLFYLAMLFSIHGWIGIPIWSM